MSAYRSAFSLNFGEPLRRLEQCHYTSCGVADYCGECKPHRWRRWWRQREQFPPVLVIGLQLVWHYVSKITQICRLKCWLKWPQIYTIFFGPLQHFGEPHIFIWRMCCKMGSKCLLLNTVTGIAHSDIHHLISGVNFLFHSASLVLINLLHFYVISHLMARIFHHHNFHHPSLLSSTSMRMSYIFSINLSRFANSTFFLISYAQRFSFHLGYYFCFWRRTVD